MLVEILPWILLLVISLLVFIAWVCSIIMLVDVYERKGGPGSHRFPVGALWFVGLFASPLVLGLIVCALPSYSTELPESDPAKQLVDQLPSI